MVSEMFEEKNSINDSLIAFGVVKLQSFNIFATVKLNMYFMWTIFYQNDRVEVFIIQSGQANWLRYIVK